MRIVLYTGKGGVGKTCVSAAAALAAARRGQRTVVMSSDRAHSLGDAFQVDLGPNPISVAPNLDALEIDPGSEIEEHWGEIQDYMRRLLTSQGGDAIRADEVAMLPGLEELCTLLRLKDFWDQGTYDALVVDCAPTGATLRLLSLPEVFGWYMRRLFHLERAAVGVLRPTAGWVLPFPLPPDDFYAAIQALYCRLLDVAALLQDPVSSGVRLVTIPEQMAVEETKRALTEFSLYGMCVEQVVINRVMPDEVTDPYLEATKAVQRRWMKQIREDFSPLPIEQAKLFAGEIAGLEALRQLAEHLFGDADPMAALRSEPPVRIEETDGACRLIVDLQFAARGEVELMQHGDELVLEIGSSRRNLLLPRGLARMRATRARIEDGSLVVEFVKDEGVAKPL